MRRVLTRFAAAVLLLGVAIVAITVWRLLQVRRDLDTAQAQVATVQSALSRGDLDAARRMLPELAGHLRSADRHSRGLAWSVTQAVPVLGNNLRAVRGVARAGRTLGDTALPEAVAAMDAVRDGHLLHDGRIDLALLQDVAARVHRAKGAVDVAQRDAEVSHRGLVPGVRRGVDKVQARLASLAQDLQRADTAVALAPAMLGADGPRDYFVAVQNNAESRATGGLVGSFAIVRADHGRLTLVHSGIDHDLQVADPPVPADPAAARFWQRLGSTAAWYSANLTPHFPDAARNLAQQWERQSKTHVDGVIGLDAPAFADLLAPTSGVTLSDGTRLTSGNVVAFICRDEYVRYPVTAVRKQLLREVAVDVFKAVTHPQSPLKLLTSVAKSDGHLLLWSAHPAEQRELQKTSVGGALPADDRAFLEVVTQNFGGNKLDYYLRRAITVQHLTGKRLRVTVALTNATPLGVPPYASDRNDHPPRPLPYGQAKTNLSVYGALSSQVSSFQVDGQPAVPQVYDRDHGHDFLSLSLELPRNVTRTVVVEMSEPPGRLTVRQQPLAVPDILRVR